MHTARPYHFCHSCGSPFSSKFIGTNELQCVICNTITYRNPAPVTNLIVPYDGGIIGVRRGVPPKQGHLALPGGFMIFGEQWRSASARETWEEVQVKITDPENDIDEFMIESIPNGTQLLAFGVVRNPLSVIVDEFVPSFEALERHIIRPETWHAIRDDIAFELHVKAIERYFKLG
jgi:hypothetical protein